MNRRRRLNRVSKKRGNGEGSITKRKDGRCMARCTVHTVKGPIRRHVYGKTRKEAADRLAKALSDRTEGVVYNNENMTVGEYLDLWLKSSVRGSIRQSTYDRDAYLVENHIKPALGRIKLKNLSSALVQGFYQDRLDGGLSASTVHKVHTIVHKALARAVAWQMVPRNVTDAVEPRDPLRGRCVPCPPRRRASCSTRLKAIGSRPSTYLPSPPA
jgi:integrase